MISRTQNSLMEFSCIGSSQYNMSTTIALKDNTYSLLKMMKEELHTDTYDNTIKRLIAKTKKPKKSYFGKFKGLGEFKREEIDRFA